MSELVSQRNTWKNISHQTFLVHLKNHMALKCNEILMGTQMVNFMPWNSVSSMRESENQ